MMQPQLQERFDLLLRQAKDPRLESLARENLAAARELINTLLAVGLLLTEEWKAYYSQVETAMIKIGAVELKRVTDLNDIARRAFADENGVRPAVAEDGAYRYNPLSGTFE